MISALLRCQYGYAEGQAYLIRRESWPSDLPSAIATGPYGASVASLLYSASSCCTTSWMSRQHCATQPVCFWTHPRGSVRSFAYLGKVVPFFRVLLRISRGVADLLWGFLT